MAATPAPNNQTLPIPTNVQRLTSLFTGNSASGSVPSPMEVGNTTTNGSKRGRVEGDLADDRVDDDPANPTFTKLDLFELLDEQSANYQKNSEVSIAKALDTFGTNFRGVAKADTKELLGKYHDKMEGRFCAVESRVGKVETTVSGMATDLTELQSSIIC